MPAVLRAVAEQRNFFPNAARDGYRCLTARGCSGVRASFVVLRARRVLDFVVCEVVPAASYQLRSAIACASCDKQALR
jgi:hypothetical protein